MPQQGIYEDTMSLDGWTSILVLISSVGPCVFGSMWSSIAQILIMQHHWCCNASVGSALQPSASQCALFSVRMILKVGQTFSSESGHIIWAVLFRRNRASSVPVGKCQISHVLPSIQFLSLISLFFLEAEVFLCLFNSITFGTAKCHFWDLEIAVPCHSDYLLTVSSFCLCSRF